MNQILRYHKDLGFPKVEVPRGLFFLRYSRHAEDATLNDKHGAIELPTTLNTNCADLIEIKTHADGTPFRYVFRSYHNESTDLSFVVQRDGAALFVVTVWLNAANDHHKTLRREEYQIPAELLQTA